MLQTNLVASGGNESEIYIWDLNNFGSPMAPGPKTQVFHLFTGIFSINPNNPENYSVNVLMTY